MKYRNKRTGAIIDVKSRIFGRDWERLEETKKVSPARRSSGKARGKQDE